MGSIISQISYLGDTLIFHPYEETFFWEGLCNVSPKIRIPYESIRGGWCERIQDRLIQKHTKNLMLQTFDLLYPKLKFA